ncbi:hypothetical protein DH2020_032942 [Rehmannia glutinosa]|uniref:Malonyl-CoA decarboxylase n=1 Tax=Rehmannia glutinosa TaxID=99300 RepID=A0ABR0VGD2_REHGL
MGLLQTPILRHLDSYCSTENEALSPLIDFEQVHESMHAAISMNKTEILDAALDDFSEGYFGLSNENRRALLLRLSKEYDLNRKQVRELMKQYLGLELPGDNALENVHEGEGSFSAFYRIERNLRLSLKPMYEVLFERLNTHPGGLRFLSTMRADILSFLAEENIAPLRALDSYLKEKLITWLSPANLQLLNITWDDPASLLEKIVAYEEVLWDDPPIPECEATCALFYSISSTQSPSFGSHAIENFLLKVSVGWDLQPGLSGINLGKFLIKRVIDVVRRDMPRISTFATLSPIPGYMQWLLSKLASIERSDSTFSENLLKPEEESALLDAAEYLLQEKKRGKALDSVGNFHLQNGAMDYLNTNCRVEHIEENAQSYFSKGQIQASEEVKTYLELGSKQKYNSSEGGYLIKDDNMAYLP